MEHTYLSEHHSVRTLVSHSQDYASVPFLRHNTAVSIHYVYYIVLLYHNEEPLTVVSCAIFVGVALGYDRSSALFLKSN